MMNDYMNINKSYIDNFIGKLYSNYKFQVDLISKIKLKPYQKPIIYNIS